MRTAQPCLDQGVGSQAIEAASAVNQYLEQTGAVEAASAFNRYLEQTGAVEAASAVSRYLELTGGSEAIKQMGSTFEALQQQVGLAGGFARVQDYLSQSNGIAGQGVSVLAAAFRAVDQLTPLHDAAAQHAAMFRASEQLLGQGAVSSWRAALASNSLIESHLRTVAEPSPLFADLTRVSRAQLSLSDWLVQRDSDQVLTSGISGQPIMGWRSFVATEVDEESMLPALLATGRTNLGLFGTEFLTTPGVDEALVVEGADRIEAVVLEPWEAAPQQARSDLFAKLKRIDPSVPELLNGAWDELHRKGPAAAEKAAHCAVEAIDRTLRGAAPDDAVRNWHTEAGRPAKEWEGRDRPTRALRVKYLLRNLPGQRDLVVAQVDGHAKVVGRIQERLQAAKHASQGDLTTLRSLVYETESLLMTILVIHDPEG